MSPKLSKLRRKIHSRDNLDAAWRVIQRNGQNSSSRDVREAIERFAEDSSKNITLLQRKLSRSQFDFGQAKGAPIKKLDGKGKPTGKIRPIVIATLEARIVQRAILNIILEIPALQPFIITPYSFGGLRKSRGPDRVENPTYSAVPAAINAVLAEIGKGSLWVAAADITAFFTKISKSGALSIIRRAIEDEDVMLLFEQAIAVELSNLSELREVADQFPIEEIGVAQGNSLSPLLGNIVLADFDRKMNEGDCSCFRYIDDFIILAPSKKAANARLKLARKLLDELSMELSPEKSSKQAQPVNDGFEFLGIEIVPGLIRPSKKARSKFVKTVEDAFAASIAAMAGMKHGKVLDRNLSAVSTLKRVDGIIQGWGKHYWFCNDRQVFSAIDERIKAKVGSYIGGYTEIRNDLPEDQQHVPLGITALIALDSKPFEYPKTGFPTAPNPA